jgi:hypothetical protein
MKKTRLIGVIIFILVIALIIVLFFIANLTILKTDNQVDANNIVSNQINDNVNSVNQNVSVNSINNTNVNEDIQNSVSEENTVNNTDTNDVFYNTEETGTVKYSENQLNNFSFEIKGITDEDLKYINDVDNLNLTVKEYVYKHGLVDATIGEVQKSEYQESTNRLGIILKLNNPNEDKLRVIVSSGNKIDISNYK